MSNFSLKLLNEHKSGSLQYLPFGVTTIEMVIEGDKNQAYGYMYVNKRSAGQNNTHIGYADDNDNFIILWGAGKEKGLYITPENISKSLFFQVLHTGNSKDYATISLMHSSNHLTPIIIIKMVPAEENEDIIRMNESTQGKNISISFKGKRMPIYYPRWFPPRPSFNEHITFHNIEVPKIIINFNVKENIKNKNFKDIDSNIDIFLDDKKIAQITGDLQYSRYHAELFTLFGNKEYLILRFWLYWIHKNFSKNILLGIDNLADKLKDPPHDEKARLQIVKSLLTEVPDNERFDFLINIQKKKVIWLGTDFHYQESWYKIDDSEPYVKARIANDADAIEISIVKGIKRLIQDSLSKDNKENYNPIFLLKDIIKENKNKTIKNFSGKKDMPVTNKEIARLREGITRKHIPYCENGKIGCGLVSSVVTA